MKYKLTITERAEELLDHILNYIVNQLKNPQAASNLMNEIEHIFDNLECSPEMYAYSEDIFLKSREYRKVVVPHYDYVIIFRIDDDSRTVYIVGFFHDLELYKNKL
ncbi:type II toxin-antitoxin system RelE/ParE family toxin [Alkalibaculum sp. M08DMB]|uniref:Type II toxin-antitoxin system RelE/ParE family toxin n=1 Tax=Alkalibaculum sporogenes TaxID=2655001 RepID=A0A6A7K8K9_9FIRM|nr:type II toxin-antitoxin system RelE/ParE family toxin [Alkalibaculum sporogenes]MPW25780.1 type II toxin-antitoxin system RelE/ParE family toxin [Alkalibaculum sporogenes]